MHEKLLKPQTKNDCFISDILLFEIVTEIGEIFQKLNDKVLQLRTLLA